ncbi:hypothetical protein [Paraflavitalea pollutisoli]|uniref:hypothetical protein n=1 Tax=Paraflavitalea pollutisoli TaxID=3034143 RepID=UPI0023EAEFE1|nr:hypothetical protein [Paraflavitalea sp. H1-2-19X]
MELSQQKSYGPVAALKTALGKQVMIIPFLIVVLIVQALRKPDLQADPFFGLFAGIIVLASAFFVSAYFILGNMSRSDAPVADRLKSQVRSLGQLLWCYRLVSLAGVVMLAVFLEVFKGVGTARLMEPWYEIDSWLRWGTYAVLLIIVFILSRSRFHKDFGKHLDEIRQNLSAIE